MLAGNDHVQIQQELLNGKGLLEKLHRQSQEGKMEETVTSVEVQK